MNPRTAETADGSRSRDLLDEVVEAVMSETDSDAVDASLPWQDQLRSSRSLRGQADGPSQRSAPDRRAPAAHGLLASRGREALRIMTDAGAQVASASAEQADVAAGNPFAGLPPEEFPLLAQAAEAGALSDGRADVLSFAVDSMIAALEAKAPPSGAMNEGCPARTNTGDNAK
jgi:hypothetical protein